MVRYIQRINCAQVPANIKVNSIAKFLYNHLDGAFKQTHSANMADVFVTLLYQIPRPQQIPGKGKEYNDVHEMTLDMNLTTYQNKLRVNVIELTPEERTLGYFLYRPEVLQDMEVAKNKIYWDVCLKVAKMYSQYEFLF